MDLTGSKWRKNPGKNAVFRRLVEVFGSRWMMKWWPGRELNPRHADFQSAALPTELPGLIEPRIKQAWSAIVNEDSQNQALTRDPDALAASIVTCDKTRISANFL